MIDSQLDPSSIDQTEGKYVKGNEREYKRKNNFNFAVNCSNS